MPGFYTGENCLPFSVLDKKAVPIAGIKRGRLFHNWESFLPVHGGEVKSPEPAKSASYLQARERQAIQGRTALMKSLSVQDFDSPVRVMKLVSGSRSIKSGSGTSKGI